jgi:hypothetical protein
MSHIFANAEYVDMPCVYGFCDGSVTAAVEEYHRRFPMRRIPYRKMFSRCSIYCVNVVRLPVFMFHLKEHVNVWMKRKTFLKWYSLALLLAHQDFLHVLAFHEHVYGEHCMMTACTHFIQSACEVYT